MGEVALFSMLRSVPGSAVFLIKRVLTVGWSLNQCGLVSSSDGPSSSHGRGGKRDLRGEGRRKYQKVMVGCEANSPLREPHRCKSFRGICGRARELWDLQHGDRGKGPSSASGERMFLKKSAEIGVKVMHKDTQQNRTILVTGAT